MHLQRHHSRVCRKTHKTRSQAQRVFKTAPLYAVTNPDGTKQLYTVQSDGQVAWQWAYSAFGDEKPTIARNRFANTDLNQSFGTSTVPAVTFNLRYPGQYFDQESNLHYNYHRSYSATVGRYTQADPIGLDGGWNRYNYVGGNPVSYTDRLGLAKDGAPLNAENCRSLRKIIGYEKANGKWKTLWKYNPFNFSDYSVSLDAAYPSTGGQVSIDWMMRSGAFGVTANPITGTATYILGKELNNSIHGNNPLLNIDGEANSNAPSAVSYWFHNKDVTLETMFGPALRECSCQGE